MSIETTSLNTGFWLGDTKTTLFLKYNVLFPYYIIVMEFRIYKNRINTLNI